MWATAGLAAWVIWSVQASAVSPACQDASTRALLAADALRGHFWNKSSGLWDQNLWWQDACALDSVAFHAQLARNTTLTDLIESDIHNMFNKTHNMSRGGPTLTGYFDDEEWWALGWLRAWELTGDAQYIKRTHIIFEHEVSNALSSTALLLTSAFASVLKEDCHCDVDRCGMECI